MALIVIVQITNTFDNIAVVPDVKEQFDNDCTAVDSVKVKYNSSYLIIDIQSCSLL